MIKLDDLFCGRGEKEEEKKEDKTKSFTFKFQHINKFDPVRFVRRVKLGEGSYGVVLQMYDKELQEKRKRKVAVEPQRERVRES